MRTKGKEKLRLWQGRLARNESAYEGERGRMDGREALYRGENGIRPIVQGERTKKTPHVRNICAELIEAQVSSSIPQPKVTARRKEDEDWRSVAELLRGLDAKRLELARSFLGWLREQSL